MNNILSLTEKASNQLEIIFQSAPSDAVGILLGVDKAGCNGHSYKLDFAKKNEVENLEYVKQNNIKVFKNHAFIVSEAIDHGLQIFDLTRLREINEFKEFIPDKKYNAFGSAHNIAINEVTGYAYIVGSQRYSGGPIFIDVNDPKNPEEVGGYRNMGYSHDAQIVIYHGPDDNFLGKEIYIGSNSDGGSNNKIVVVDVTDKNNPQLISTKSYSGSGYAHQSWLSSNHKFLFFSCIFFFAFKLSFSQIDNDFGNPYIRNFSKSPS